MRSDMYYPKAAKFFREKADEEMQHAEKFIEYQNRRGGSFAIQSVQVKIQKCKKFLLLNFI